METKLNSTDRLRVTTGHTKNNYIDIECGQWELALEVSFLASKQYMEIRKKSGHICSFYFESKRHKKEYDFKWWEDAEVIFSNNDVNTTLK